MREAFVAIQPHVERRPIRIGFDGEAPLIDHDGDQLEGRRRDQLVHVREERRPALGNTEEFERREHERGN